MIRPLVKRSARARALAMAAMFTASLTLAGRASSEGLSPKREAVAEEAERLYSAGNRAREQENWREAYEYYKRALTLKYNYDILGNLGAMEVLIGKPREGAEHLTESLERFPQHAQQESRSRTYLALNEARKHIGSAIVSVDREGADLYVDDGPVGKTPHDSEIFLDPGHHIIRAKLAGYEDASMAIDVVAGQGRVDIDLKLVPKPAAPEKPVRSATQDRLPPPRDPTLVWVGGGVALAGFGTALAFYLAAESEFAHADEMLPGRTGAHECSVPGVNAAACASVRDALNRADTYQVLARVGLAVGALAGIATGAYVLWPTTRPTAAQRAAATPLRPPAAIEVSPMFSGASSGVEVHGRF